MLGKVRGSLICVIIIIMSKSADRRPGCILDKYCAIKAMTPGVLTHFICSPESFLIPDVIRGSEDDRSGPMMLSHGGCQALTALMMMMMQS